MKVLDKVMWVAVFFLIGSVAAAGSYWVVSSPLIYHVNEYSISMTGSPEPSTVSKFTTVSFTITLLYGDSPAAAQTVYLYDGETQLLSGTTDIFGQCIMQYQLTEARNYNFTGRYQTP